MKTLTATLAKLRKGIVSMRERKDSLGEQNTKATLIEPLLAALGWDMEDVDEVCREYKRKSQDNPVDYALFKASLWPAADATTLRVSFCAHRLIAIV